MRQEDCVGFLRISVPRCARLVGFGATRELRWLGARFIGAWLGGGGQGFKWDFDGLEEEELYGIVKKGEFSPILLIELCHNMTEH